MSATPKLSRAASVRESLTSELARHLIHPPEKGQPLILRQPVGRTGKQNLFVIWEKWKGIPFNKRSEIILEANDSLEGSMKADLSLALGRTMDEAISLGYLPFRIAAAENRVDASNWEQVEAAMKEEGAVETGAGLQLRFATIEDAQDTYMRLQQKLPGPFWMIIEEVL